MKQFVICLAISMYGVSLWSQSITSFTGDWKRACNQWDSTTETWVPVMEILRITQSNSGAYYIVGKDINALDGSTRSYLNIKLESYIDNGIVYSQDCSGCFEVFYYRLTFDGDVAKRECMYYIDKQEGKKQTTQGVDYYYRNNEDW